ncbi:dephospho-CoA kinase, partial [Wolbachia endosymbiont of Nasonia vitripennis]|uniref:dephospho-CoA kinase n=1 Tax=Wolbachia endosymbiont of Nasonia vitripennis TaxID=180837 RepID=UPI0002374CAB
NGKIDRAVLSEYFLAYDENWKQFQSLVHSVVRNELEIFIAQEKKNDRKSLVLDIPLLLEPKQDSVYIAILLFLSLIHADSAVQAQRLSERNMDKEKLNLMSSIQLPIEEKRQMSDFIIDTSANVFSQVKKIVDSLNLNT